MLSARSGKWLTGASLIRRLRLRSVYLPAAFSVLIAEELEIATFKEQFKLKTGLGDSKIRDFLAWATAGGNPVFATREERGIGRHKKWIRMNPARKKDPV